MVEKGHPQLSVATQCRLLSIPRSTFYYRPAGETVENLVLMQIIDRQFMETPFYGVRQMTWYLKNEGHAVNPKRVRRLMRLMGLMPIYRKPNTSKPAKGRQPYPYLLRGLAIDRPNQVWCADITYLPMQRGFLYLVAIMDWHSRRMLSWRLSNTLEAEFCADALDEAIARFGPPEIMNTPSRDIASDALPGSRPGIAVHGLRLDRSAPKGGHPHLTSLWTARGASWTTSSSSGSGGR
jgi:putative transposase